MKQRYPKIIIVYGCEVDETCPVVSGMFKDRAYQFRDRLGWPVHVNEFGWETDEYDTMNPMYLIYMQPDGSHGGSLRLLPTCGPNMINDHFLELNDGYKIESPYIWECTRFCLSPSCSSPVAASLMLFALELGLILNLKNIVAVFDQHMFKVYERLGWAPMTMPQNDGPVLGAWSIRPSFRSQLARKADLRICKKTVFNELDNSGSAQNISTEAKELHVIS